MNEQKESIREKRFEFFRATEHPNRQEHSRAFRDAQRRAGGKRVFPGSKFKIPDSENRNTAKAAKCIIIILLSALGARAGEPSEIQDSKFKIPDSRFERQATAATPTPSWTNRRLYKLIAIGALHAAGAFDAYETNSLIGDRPPTVSVMNGNGTTSTTTFTSQELNPLLRPFAGGWALYPAVESGDGLLSAWLLKARSSRSRKAAWIAVSAQIGLHIGLGINNWRQHDAQWAMFHGVSAPGAGAAQIFRR